MDVIQGTNLTKKFGKVTAVESVDFRLQNGQVCALVGDNGAGKSTFLKMLVGLLAPTSGTVDICGINLKKNPVEAKKHFGYVSDNPEGYSFLSGSEFLDLTARLRSMTKAQFIHRKKELLSIFPIETILTQQMKQYSRGNKQKVALMASMLTQPDILIVDEPIVGLDPGSIKALGEAMRAYSKQGKSVLFVTHILDFAKLYATRIITMKNGKLV